MILRSPRPQPLPSPWRGLSAAWRWRTLVTALLFLGALSALLPAADASAPCSAVCSCLGSFVDCSYRSLTKIPDDLPVWTEVLHLQHNFITNITHESLRGLTGLTELDVGNNLIVNAKDFVAELPLSIRKLKLNNNKILEFDLSANLTQLAHLDLRSNNIYQLRHLDRATGLDLLDLADNQLKHLFAPSGDGDSSHTLLPSSLTKLRLNHNRIVNISKETFRALVNLQTLDLSANAIVEVEGLAFHGLKSLTFLNLERNAIENLNDGSLYGLAELKRLSLQNNAISAVTRGWLYGLDTLETLNLTNNKVEEIEDGCWDFTKQLLTLDLSVNSLTTIGRGTFSLAYNLATLDLSRNQITHVADDALKQLRRLQSLDVSDNQIGHVLETTASVFSWPKGIQKLRLSRIGAVTLSSKAFGSLKNLRELDLSLNEIAMVEPNAFRDLVSLHNLILNSNSMVCDCDIKDFLRTAQTKTFPDAHFKCAFPPELKGRHLKSLTPSQLKCFDKPRPKIERHPESKVAVVGSNFTLNCSVSFPASSASAIIVRWKKDDMFVVNPDMKTSTSRRGNFTVMEAGLALTDVDRSNSGTYQCIASNNFGSVFSNKSRVAVHVFPTFLKHPQNVSVRIGSTARLECSATGSPKPEIRWKKNGGPEFPAAKQRRLLKESEHVMKIINATLEDAGTYTCIAENAAGAAMANATITVSESLTDTGSVYLTDDPFTKLILAGGKSMFECQEAKEGRWKRVQWLRNGEMLLTTERHFLPSDGQILMIADVVEQDAGIYQCESGTTGDMGSVYTLRVQKRSCNFWEVGCTSIWIWIAIAAGLSVCFTSLLCLLIFRCRQGSKVRSGGSSTSTDDTVLPDELHPINGLHPSESSSLNSPMADFNDYLAVGSDYSVEDEYAASASGRGRSYSQQRPQLKSFSSSESPSFANYLTLKATRTNKAYLPSPNRSCNTLPRVLR